MMTKAHLLPMSLRCAYLTMHRQTNACLTKFNITADQFVCLIILAEEKGITQQELVRRAASDPNTIRAMLVLLENRELVERRKHPTDGRARLVILTDKGDQLVQKLVLAVKPVQDKLSRIFEGNKVITFLEGLNKITEAMNSSK